MIITITILFTITITITMLLRYYILDLLRTFPPDVNFLKVEFLS